MILLLGGTSDALALAKGLSQAKLPFLMTVTSSYGAMCAQDYNDALWIGHLDETGFQELMTRYAIKYVVDATHPHAQKISQDIQRFSQEVGILYFRYERETFDEQSHETHLYGQHVFYVNSVDEAARKAASLGQRIMVTGSKHIREYTNYLKDSELFARIIPSPQVLSDVIRAGVLPKRVIAMQGPFSEGLNRELFTSLNLDVLVTKESGSAGGFLEKLRAAKACDMKVVVIRRPSVHYTHVFSRMECLVDELLKLYTGGTTND